MNYKCLIVVEIMRKFCIQYIGVVTVFLYGFLNKVIYIEQLHLVKIGIDKVCKLLKTLYRLKQASNIWYKTLIIFFCKLGFLRLKFDHSIFVLEDK